MPASEIDAFLLLSFGGPEGPADVMPFLKNVTNGRNIPESRLVEVADHYMQFGGISPINQHCRDLIVEIKDKFDATGIELPIYWGNRNWHPMIEDTFAQMVVDGRKHAVVFATSAFSSYSSCRQYHEDLARGRESAGALAPQVTKIAPYYGHPGFINGVADQMKSRVPVIDPDKDVVLFTAHSIPVAMANGSAYTQQLQNAATLVMKRLQWMCQFEVAYQSRSGQPGQHWLEPDIGDRIGVAAKDGLARVIVVPIGFISDHIEVIFDLDIEARRHAQDSGVDFVRIPAVGTSPSFVDMIPQLVKDVMSGQPHQWLDKSKAGQPFCGDGCCPANTAI